MYYGAYEGYNNSNKWRSLSGKANTNDISYTHTRTYCKNNGSKYGMESYCKRWYILGLLMLVCKGRDIKSIIGQGVWKQPNTYPPTNAINTGTMNNRGLFYGRSIYTEGVKCFGIENMWGNYYQWIDGVVTTSATQIGFKATAPYNDTGSGYTAVTDGFPRMDWYTTTNMIPVLNGAAMVASIGQSDHTIGWVDDWFTNIGVNVICYAGGIYGNTEYQTGPFHFMINGLTSSYRGQIGRLMAA